MNQLWLIITLALWGIIHSWLASIKVKEMFSRAFGTKFTRFYRLAYNIFAALSFLPILWLMIILPNKILYSIPPPWHDLMLAGEGISALLLIVSLLQTDVLSFVGLRQLFETKESSGLITSGFYRYMRHPLYTFGLSILWLSPNVSVNSFIVYLGLTLYILIGIYFEERKLLREFGEDYARYRNGTPMLIPRLIHWNKE